PPTPLHAFPTRRSSDLQSQAATAQQNLVQATAARQTAELALKRLIVSGTQDPNWTAALDPVDRPDFVPQAVDIEAAVRRALDQRDRKSTRLNSSHQLNT